MVDGIVHAYNQSTLAQNITLTLTNGTDGFHYSKQSEHAAIYIIVVVLTYGISIFLLLMVVLCKKKRGVLHVDREVNRFLRSIEDTRRMLQKHEQRTEVRRLVREISAPPMDDFVRSDGPKGIMRPPQRRTLSEGHEPFQFTCGGQDSQDDVFSGSSQEMDNVDNLYTGIPRDLDFDSATRYSHSPERKPPIHATVHRPYDSGVQHPLSKAPRRPPLLKYSPVPTNPTPRTGPDTGVRFDYMPHIPEDEEHHDTDDDVKVDKDSQV